MGSGLPATADLLLSVLQAQGGSSAAAAARVLQSALRPSAPHDGPPTALASLDSLSQLHLTAQATAAAAMQRAAEVCVCGGGVVAASWRPPAASLAAGWLKLRLTASALTPLSQLLSHPHVSRSSS